MNKKLAFVLASVAFLLTGCFEWESEYTPSLTVTSFVTASGDTLKNYYNSETNIHGVDTILMGDTVSFTVISESFANNLVSTYIDWDSTMVKLWTITPTDDFMKILQPTTNIDILHFDYVTGYNLTLIPVKLTPLKTGNSQLKFQVISDSKFAEKSGTIEVRVAESKSEK